MPTPTTEWQAVQRALRNGARYTSQLDAEIAKALLDRLAKAGSFWDSRFRPDMNVPPSPSVLIESQAHVTWRTQRMPGAIARLNQLGALLDGEPTTPTGADLVATAAAIRTRIERALAASDLDISAPIIAVARKALAAPLPPEPRFYVDSFYEGGGFSSSNVITKENLTLANTGEIELHLVRVLAECEAFLALL